MYVCVLFLREGGIGVVGWCYFLGGVEVGCVSVYHDVLLSRT